MFPLKHIVLASIAVAALISGSSIAYYYGYSRPQTEKEVLALQIAELSKTPTPTPSLTPAPTASPSAIPTIVIRYIVPSLTPTPTHTGVLDLIQANNKCIGQCYHDQEAKDNASCANNTMSCDETLLSDTERINCMNTCKNKYNQ